MIIRVFIFIQTFWFQIIVSRESNANARSCPKEIPLDWEGDIPWFHGIFSAFSLSLVCVQKPFCINFYISFSLFSGNLSKDERESF